MAYLASTLEKPEIRSRMEAAFFAAKKEPTHDPDLAALDPLLNRGFDLIVADRGELPGLTLSDLQNAWRSSTIYPEDEFESCYFKFGEAVANEMNQRWRSEPIALEVDFPFAEAMQFPHSETIWETADHQYAIYLLGQLPRGERLRSFGEDLADCQSTRLFVTIEGAGTRAFFEKLCKKLTLVLERLLECVERLCSLWITSAFESEDLRSWGLDLRLVNIVASSDEEEELGAPTLFFVRECFNALFADLPIKKRGNDSIRRRAKNAVRLLIEAKGQSDNALGLALSVAAIEALVCPKTDNIAHTFAERMTILLEPDPEHKAAAEQWFKKLYGRRSEVLHGSALECDPDEVRNAECATTAALKAVLAQLDGQRRLEGSDPDLGKFFEELSKMKYRSSQPVFVPKLPVNRLWRGA